MYSTTMRSLSSGINFSEFAEKVDQFLDILSYLPFYKFFISNCLEMPQNNEEYPSPDFLPSDDSEDHTYRNND